MTGGRVPLICNPYRRHGGHARKEAKMLQVIGNAGEEKTIENVGQLVPLIPANMLESLRQQVNDDDTLNDYLEKFIGQNRRITVNALGEYVSTVVRILHWKDNGKLPGDRGYADWVMFHYLTPDAQAAGGRGSEIWKRAKDAIGRAQHEWKFSGAKVLGLYAGYTEFFKDQGIDAGDQKKLAELGDEAWAGSSVDPVVVEGLRVSLEQLPGGKPFIMPFSYGAHQTYIRVSYSKPSYRLEYFDRQRQPLTLKDKEISGYLQGPQGTEMVDAKPLYLEFEMDPGSLASLCREAALNAAEQSKINDTLVDGPRKIVLEKFAGAAKDVGVFGAAAEPAQHPDAINCPWASLESVIRLFVGPEALRRQVAFIREVAITLYIAEYGDAEEKKAAGLRVIA